MSVRKAKGGLTGAFCADALDLVVHEAGDEARDVERGVLEGVERDGGALPAAALALLARGDVERRVPREGRRHPRCRAGMLRRATRAATERRSRPTSSTATTASTRADSLDVLLQGLIEFIYVDCVCRTRSRALTLAHETASHLVFRTMPTLPLPRKPKAWTDLTAVMLLSLSRRCISLCDFVPQLAGSTSPSLDSNSTG